MGTQARSNKATTEKNTRNQEFIPALGFRIRTPLYDPILKLTLRESKWKSTVVEELAVGNGEVLDLGCGTGTMTVKIARRYPDLTVHGIDINPDTLSIAQSKISEAGQNIHLVRGTITDLPYPDDRFACVASSLALHHLTTDQKLTTISEVYRVLRQSGEFHLIDWGRPTSRLQRASLYLIQSLDGFETTSDNVEGNFPKFLDQNG